MAGNQGVVLVVDDGATIRNLVTLLLEREGYHVLITCSGQDALDLSRARVQAFLGAPCREMRERRP